MLIRNWIFFILILTSLISPIRTSFGQSLFIDNFPIDDPNSRTLGPFEATIGPVDEKEAVASLPLSSRLRQLSNPIGLLSISLKSGKTGRCTASLIKNDLILTNRHCHNATSTGMTFTLDFVDSDKSTWTVIPVHLNPLELGSSVEKEDYAVFRLKRPAPSRYGTILLNPQPLFSDLPLIVIQHPSGRPKMVAEASCTLIEEDMDSGRIEHSCDTERGSSGAPVMEAASGQVVALHQASLKSRPVNVGLSMRRLVEASSLLSAISSEQARAHKNALSVQSKANQAYGGFVARVKAAPQGLSQPMTFEVSTEEACELALIDLNFISGGVFIVDQSLIIEAGTKVLTGADFLGPPILNAGERRTIPYRSDVVIGSNEKAGENNFMFLCFPISAKETNIGLAPTSRHPFEVEDYVRKRSGLSPFVAELSIQVR